MYVSFLFLSTLNDTTMNFTLPLINEWIQAKRCPILWTKFIFKTICFGLRNCNVNAKDKKDVYLSYIATRCLFVCLSSISSGTAGPICLNFFLLAPSWSRDGFRPKKFRIHYPVFPKIRKNRFWREIIKYFYKNLRIFM